MAFYHFCLLVAFAALPGSHRANQVGVERNIDADFIEALALVRKHGFGDPKEGHLSRVTLPVGNPWNGSLQPFETLGWVVPGGKVLATNGLTYTPLATGQAVDLREVLVIDGDARFLGAEEGPMMSAPSTRVAMLRLLGREADAERLGGMNHAGSLAGALISDYLWNRYERALAAHMRGDLGMALEEFHALEWSQEDRARVAALGGRFPEEQDGIRALKEDEARRLRNAGSAPNLAAIAAMPQEKRIRALIERLDQVSARQMSQPGGVHLSSDPIVRALIQEGEAAGEPLIDTAEHDKRFTRSVSFGRDFKRSRHPLTVSQAALAGFKEILGVYELPGEREGRYDFQAIRVLWQQIGHLSMPERWLRILQDDTAAPDRWVDAATRLTEPSEVKREGGSVSIPKYKEGRPTSPMKGEAIRESHDTEVREVLAKRAIELAGSGPLQSSIDEFNFMNASVLGASLAKWSPASARDVLAKLSERGRTLAASEQARDDQMLLARVRVEEWRLRLGEDAAWKDLLDAYTVTSASVSNPEALLMPISSRPSNAQAVEVANKLIGQPTSNWNLEAQAKLGRVSYVESLLKSPMLAFSVVRKQAMAFLSDQQVIGEAWAGKQGYVSFRIPVSGASGGTGLTATEGYVADEHRPLRMQDIAAMSLTKLEGAPKYVPVWSDDQKAKGIEDMKAFVRTEGANLANRAKAERPWWFD